MTSSAFTKSAIEGLFVGAAIALWAGGAPADTLRETVLRKAALDAGFVRAEATHVAVAPKVAAAGKALFESKLLSVNRDIACASCHLDQFGSADGLPIAVGTGGHGVGAARAMSGGQIVPRNTQPLWGRGGIGFNVFFWDGKVDGSTAPIKSQFEDRLPSDDALVVAVHLPPAEIGEMVVDSDETRALETETVDSAMGLYAKLVDRVRKDPFLGQSVAAAQGKSLDQLKFLDVAEVISGFIRENFQVQPTKFHRFVFDGGALSSEEIAGGLLFYGRGGCSLPQWSLLLRHEIACDPVPAVRVRPQWLRCRLWPLQRHFERRRSV